MRTERLSAFNGRPRWAGGPPPGKWVGRGRRRRVARPRRVRPARSGRARWSGRPPRWAPSLVGPRSRPRRQGRRLRRGTAPRLVHWAPGRGQVAWGRGPGRRRLGPGRAVLTYVAPAGVKRCRALPHASQPGSRGGGRDGAVGAGVLGVGREWSPGQRRRPEEQAVPARRGLALPSEVASRARARPETGAGAAASPAQTRRPVALATRLRRRRRRCRGGARGGAGRAAGRGGSSPAGPFQPLPPAPLDGPRPRREGRAGLAGRLRAGEERAEALARQRGVSWRRPHHRAGPDATPSPKVREPRGAAQGRNLQWLTGPDLGKSFGSRGPREGSCGRGQGWSKTDRGSQGPLAGTRPRFRPTHLGPRPSWVRRLVPGRAPGSGPVAEVRRTP